MPSGSTTQARIRELSALIHQYNFSYYCGNNTETRGISTDDETYDALVYELKSLENQYNEWILEDSHTLIQISSKSQRETRS